MYGPAQFFDEYQNRFPHRHQPMNRDRLRNQPHRPYDVRWWNHSWSRGASTMISEACILVLFQLISRPSADDSSFMISRAKMRTSNTSAIIETSSAKSRSVNTSWPTLTPTKPRWTERLVYPVDWFQKQVWSNSTTLAHPGRYRKPIWDLTENGKLHIRPRSVGPAFRRGSDSESVIVDVRRRSTLATVGRQLYSIIRTTFAQISRRKSTFRLKLLGVYTVRSSDRPVGPTGLSDWSDEAFTRSDRRTDRVVGQTQATSDCLSDQSDRPVGQTVAEPPTSVNHINVAC